MARGAFSSANFLSANPSGPLAVGGTVLTVAGWGKFGALTDSKWVNRYDGVNGWGLILRSTGVVAGFIMTGSATDTANSAASAVTTGVWYHVAFVKNGTGAGALKLYLNGAEVTSVTSNRSIGTPSADFRWGRRTGTAEALTGEICETPVWSVALTAAEILALSKGVSPLLIRPVSLAWFSGWGVGAAGEPDLQPTGASDNMTESGTVTVTNHAPVGPPFPIAV